MPTMTGYQRLPKFFKMVGKPANTSTRDLENAQPIYIDGLPAEGSGVSQEDFNALVARVVALEATPGG